MPRATAPFSDDTSSQVPLTEDPKDLPPQPSLSSSANKLTVENFELNLWGLDHQPLQVRQALASIYRHEPFQDLSQWVQDWPLLLAGLAPGVSPAHLFASGAPRSHGMKRSRDLLMSLMEQGVVLDQHDAYGWLPINYAVWFGHAATTDLLLEAGSPVQNTLSPQPLDSALLAISHYQQNAEECARLLLLHGANPCLGMSMDPTFGGMTWLSWALREERLDWAQLLWSKGLRVLPERECQMMAMQGSHTVLEWLQRQGLNMIGFVQPTHPSYQHLLLIQAQMEAQVIAQALAFPTVSHAPLPHRDKTKKQNEEQNEEQDDQGSAGGQGGAHGKNNETQGDEEDQNKGKGKGKAQWPERSRRRM